MTVSLDEPLVSNFDPLYAGQFVCLSDGYTTEIVPVLKNTTAGRLVHLHGMTECRRCDVAGRMRQAGGRFSPIHHEPPKGA